MDTQLKIIIINFDRKALKGTQFNMQVESRAWRYPIFFWYQYQYLFSVPNFSGTSSVTYFSGTGSYFRNFTDYVTFFWHQI